VQDGSLIPRFGRARRDPSLAVLEGFHPLKHALRFGANVIEVVCSDPGELERLAMLLAPDLADQLLALARRVELGVFAQLAPLVPATGVVALAKRPAVDPALLLADRRSAPVVLLEDPRDLGNLGACVRVAAAADVAGVLSTGSHDPWSPDALRGGAGLQFALPVARLDSLAMLDSRAAAGGSATALGAPHRPLLALDPSGEPLRPSELPARAVLAFGTERYGLSDELLARADARISIPMRTGVSSLNLATSVAAVLFAWRLAGEPGVQPAPPAGGP
jgi:TrmH family RNA methyltransferase